MTSILARFAKLDSDHSGSLDMKEFMAMPELRGNPLVQVLSSSPSLLLLLPPPARG